VHRACRKGSAAQHQVYRNFPAGSLLDEIRRTSGHSVIVCQAVGKVARMRDESRLMCVDTVISFDCAMVLENDSLHNEPAVFCFFAVIASHDIRERFAVGVPPCFSGPLFLTGMTRPFRKARLLFWAE
jgi:hypothetical protein